MGISVGRLIAGGMLLENTPLEDYTKEFGLWVKREDLSCPNPGPHFSKTRGVYARIKSRPEKIIGALDTYHSQAGHAVARACQVLGKQCINYYPEYKYEPGPRKPQLRAKALGARLVGLPAGRSAILFHQAKNLCEAESGYMMPNALKLEESIAETAKEVPSQPFQCVIIPASSGTIAAGVIRGLYRRKLVPKLFIIHLGYSRSHEAVLEYLESASGIAGVNIELVDEGYAYKDQARKGEIPLWPCNTYYDLKAFRWWMSNRDDYGYNQVLFWNIG
ncbi:PLP-dependent lyase/thiolase [Candidatus Pacearchaeota archaeon]|jgi:hypothetical protein|nr:PLP-dependent lyase/thiolase [Candidatus Pacearchaeota archaeon]